MLFSVIIIAFAVVGVLLTLLTAAVIGFYLSPVPGGSNAVGLVIPFFMAIAAGLAGLISGAVLGSRGGLDWLGFSRSTAMALVISAAILVGLSILGSFLAWAERHRLGHPGLLMCSGILLPVCYFGFVVAVVWTQPSSTGPSIWVRGLGMLTGLAMLSGLIAACLMVQSYLARSARAEAYRMEQQTQEQQEKDRRNAMSPEQRLLEDLSKFDVSAPLWTLTAGLPTEKNPSLRAIWIERAFQVPNLDDEMRQTLTGQYGSYRHGCVVLILEAPGALLQRPSWPSLLAQDASLTAEDIRKFGNLFKHDDDDLGLHVSAIARAALQFPRADDLHQSLTRLREVVSAVGTATDRSQLLQPLDGAIAHHATPPKSR